jgi:hypothetical protein
VITVPTELLTQRPRSSTPPPFRAVQAGRREHDGRIRRLRLNAAAWGVGTIGLTALWVENQWSANGALESFGHEGDPGQWNPTLWALAVGLWGLVVGIMALGVLFTGRRLAFHATAWLLGMAVLTPLWALIEWQDNGAFERWSNASRPGDWDPWIVTVGAVWALAIVVLTLWDRRRRLER